MTLTKSLFISRNALREALQVLAREGVVYRRPRYGTSVTRPGISIPLDELMSIEERAEGTGVQLELRRIPTNDMIRLQLGGDAESVLLSEQVVYFDDEPMCVRDLLSRYRAPCRRRTGHARRHRRRPTRAPRLPSRSSSAKRLGRIANRIQVVAGDPDGCALLGIPSGSPVLLRETVHVDEERRPRMVGYSHYRGDMASFSWETAEPPRHSSRDQRSGEGAAMFHMGWFLDVRLWGVRWNKQWAGNVGKDVARPGLFVDMATSLERAGFDYMMLEDSSVLPDVYEGSLRHSLKTGVVRHDPMPLIPLLGAATKPAGHHRDRVDQLLPAVPRGPACSAPSTTSPRAG